MRFPPRALHAYLADARDAFRHGPVEILLGLTVAVALSIQLRSGGVFGDEAWVTLAASAAVAFPPVFAASILRARGVIGGGARWGATLLALLGATLYGVAVFDPDLGAERWRWATLVLAELLAVPLVAAVPLHPPAERRLRVWRLSYRLLLRLGGVLGYALLLFLALAGAVAAVVGLFELDSPDHLYGEIAGGVFYAFAPWVFVGGIPRLAEEPPSRAESAPLEVSRLGRFLYAPVLVLYLLILYAYVAKIGATGELPRNLVSPLVLAAAILGVVGAVLLEPVHHDPSHRGLSWLIRTVPILVLPLVPFATWTITERVEQHGWTEFRYLRLAVVAMVTALGILGTLRLLRGRPPLLATTLAVLSGGLLWTAVGPWSASAVSRRDQTARLAAGLADAGAVERRWAARDTLTVDSALFVRVVGSADYLFGAHGPDAVRRAIPTLPDSVRSGWVLAEALRLVPGCTPSQPALVVASLEWEGGIPGIRGGTLQRFEVDGAGAPVGTRLGKERLQLQLSGDTLLLSGAEWAAPVELSGVRRSVMARHSAACGPVRPDRASWIDAREAVIRFARGAQGAGQLVVTSVVLSAEGDPGLGRRTRGTVGRSASGSVRFQRVEGFLVLPERPSRTGPAPLDRPPARPALSPDDQ